MKHFQTDSDVIFGIVIKFVKIYDSWNNKEVKLTIYNVPPKPTQNG